MNRMLLGVKRRIRPTTDNSQIPPELKNTNKTTNRVGAIIFVLFTVLSLITVMTVSANKPKTIDAVIVDKKVVQVNKSYAGMINKNEMRHIWVVRKSDGDVLQLQVSSNIYDQKKIGDSVTITHADDTVREVK